MEATVSQPSADLVTPPTQVEIAGITDSVILRYFETLNQGDFQATSSLFATDGAMHPPFEAPIVGPSAIAEYLEAEAIGIILKPKQGTEELLENGDCQIQVTGKVQTPLLGVNVTWTFILNLNKEILLAKIKLLASPQELLNLRR